MKTFCLIILSNFLGRCCQSLPRGLRDVTMPPRAPHDDYGPAGEAPKEEDIIQCDTNENAEEDITPAKCGWKMNATIILECKGHGTKEGVKWSYGKNHGTDNTQLKNQCTPTNFAKGIRLCWLNRLPTWTKKIRKLFKPGGRKYILQIKNSKDMDKGIYRCYTQEVSGKKTTLGTVELSDPPPNRLPLIVGICVAVAVVVGAFIGVNIFMEKKLAKKQKKDAADELANRLKRKKKGPIPAIDDGTVIETCGDEPCLLDKKLKIGVKKKKHEVSALTSNVGTKTLEALNLTDMSNVDDIEEAMRKKKETEENAQKDKPKKLKEAKIKRQLQKAMQNMDQKTYVALG